MKPPRKRTPWCEGLRKVRLPSTMTPMRRALLGSLLLAGTLAASEVRNPPAPPSMADEAMGGEKGPFYPSAVHTADGAPVPARVFLGSETCGRSGCHPDVLGEWKSSAHASSGLSNPWYRKAYEYTREGAGAVPAKWCAGCHSPALLLSGALGAGAPPADPEVAHAGVTCTTCHAVSGVRSTMGQGDYEIGVPPGLARLASSDPKVRAAAVKSIRKNPAEHRKELGNPVLATAAFCSTCHKSHLDKPVNGVGWAREDSDYDSWQVSSISGQGARAFYQPAAPRDCAGCHMPRETLRGKTFRSHRFAAANSALPALHGDRGQLRAVETALKGSMRVDIFAMTEPSQAGAEATAANVVAPLDHAAVRRGESRRIDVVVRNLGVGHFFPGGKQDVYDCWLELKAVDDRGRVVFWSGRADEGSPVDPGAHFYRSYLVDEKGGHIDRRDTWAARAVVYQRRIQPNAAQVVHYRMDVPGDAGSSLTLTAHLLYRKFAWDYTRWAGVTRPMPILTVAEDSVRLDVLPSGAALPEIPGKLDPKQDWERFNDYGIALFFKRDLKGAQRAFLKVQELVPGAPDGWVNLGLVYLTEGDIAAARPQLEKALALDPGLARTHFFLGQLEQNAGDSDKALLHLRKVAERFPDDRGVLAEIAGIQSLQKDFRGAVETLERILAGDPEDRAAHYSLILAQRALGNKEQAEYHQKIYQRLAPLDPGGILDGKYWAAHPHENNERQGVHEHGSAPLKP
jgi:Flp pilus assembly protein TadD